MKTVINKNKQNDLNLVSNILLIPIVIYSFHIIYFK